MDFSKTSGALHVGHTAQCFGRGAGGWGSLWKRGHHGRRGSGAVGTQGEQKWVKQRRT